MKGALLAVALAAIGNAAVIENRQIFRTTTRRGPGAEPTGGSVERCGLDAFAGHTAEASLFCSSLLKGGGAGGTATSTATYTARDTTTTRTTVYTTIYPPSTAAPSSTPKPPSSTPAPPVSTPSSTPRPPSSTPPTPPSSLPPTPPSSSPAPSASASCGIVGYTKSTAAYYFDSSGTKNTFAACSAACKGDTKCKSFGYGESNCMLFDVTAADNVNYNPMSPYTFYDQACPVELPVRKRQINISLNLPGGPSSACSCLIGGAAATTTTTTTTVTSNRVTTTETVTRTVSLLPDSP
ncbi:hypothetical protein BDV96DRAFT_584035 [Lophiotrema nucula]|uniref:Apple domain-containing protein n=1 Tax=Lophiotrema nucula TaxID=690887 RepID=A0A6A5YTX4_9PLEO|nr:hypothetical protein BDV96DRAFT_584035 [Lophiotrema nucula]